MTIVERLDKGLDIAREKNQAIVQIDLSRKDFLEFESLAVSNASIISVNANTFRGHLVNFNDVMGTSMIISTGGAIFLD